MTLIMSRSTNFNSRFTSYEFVKSAKASGFSFTCYKEKVEWDRLAQVDLDRVVREVDISTLQEHISTVVRCDLGELRGVDPGLVTLFRLAQLCLEYCIFCQEQLALWQSELELAHEQDVKEIENLQKQLRIKKEELKRELKKRKHLNEEKENFFAPVCQCTLCPKVFSSMVFLDSHVQRRHANIEKAKSNLSEPSETEVRFKTELETLQLELLQEKQAHEEAMRAAREAHLAKEEALWSQVENIQADQRARHQAELLELTQTFQAQLKKQLAEQQLAPRNVNPRELEYREQLASLQHQLELKNQDDIQSLRLQMKELWQKRIEGMQIVHQIEMEKLQNQLDYTKAEEEQVTGIDSLHFEAATTSTALINSPAPAGTPSSQSVPKPTARQRRSDFHRHTLESTAASKASESLSLLATTTEDPSAATQLPSTSATPPPPVPRRRLPSSKVHERAKGSPEQLAWSPATSTTNKSKSEQLDSQKTPPKLQKPTQIVQQTPVDPVYTSTSSEEEADVPKSIQEMKEALQQNPAILEALKNDVEAHVHEKLHQLGVDKEDSGMNQKDFYRVTAVIDHHRKLAKKKFKEYSHIRDVLEETVENKMIQQGITKEQVSNESNVKPSKAKRFGHTGFFARLSHYHRKSKRKTEESNFSTSTPLKRSEANSTDNLPQSILKVPGGQQSRTETSTRSEPSSPVTSPKTAQSLERAQSSQSLPPPKMVTFATLEYQPRTASSSSWDDEPESPQQKPQVVNKVGVTKEPNVGEINEVKTKDRPKSAFQSPISDADQMKVSTAKIAQQPITAAVERKSSPVADENSWDLEDL